jgi:hypothetical protein
MQLFALHFGHFTKMMPFAGRTEKQEKQERCGAAFAEKKSHLPEHSSFYLAARARAKRQASSSCYSFGRRFRRSNRRGLLKLKATAAGLL